MNEQRKYWNRLSYDFIEPFRVLIDRAVLQIIKESWLSPDDFTFTDDKSHMIHKDEAFKTSFFHQNGVVSCNCLKVSEKYE